MSWTNFIDNDPTLIFICKLVSSETGVGVFSTCHSTAPRSQWLLWSHTHHYLILIHKLVNSDWCSSLLILSLHCTLFTAVTFSSVYSLNQCFLQVLYSSPGFYIGEFSKTDQCVSYSHYAKTAILFVDCLISWHTFISLLIWSIFCAVYSVHLEIMHHLKFWHIVPLIFISSTR